MSEEKLKGLKDEAVGKVKETEGKLTDDKVRKTQGKAQGLLGKARKKAADLKSLNLYVKPEENTVYYVFNDDESGSFAID